MDMNFKIVVKSDLDKSTIIQIYNMLSHIVEVYPSYKNWYYCKVVPELHSFSRKVVLGYWKDLLCGFVILKPSENKMCTMFVNPTFSASGFGKLIFEASLQELNCRNPFFTISEKYLQSYLPLLKYFNFSPDLVYLNYYKPHSIEFAFNGHLPQKKAQTYGSESTRKIILDEENKKNII